MMGKIGRWWFNESIQSKNDPIKNYSIMHFYIKLLNIFMKEIKGKQKRRYNYIHRSYNIYHVEYEPKL